MRRDARAAIAVVFVANGMGGPSFLPRLPERQADLGLSDLGLGIVLVGLAVGALAASPVAGRAVGRMGSRAVVVGAAVAWRQPVDGGCRPHPVVLFRPWRRSGAADAAMDIAMNANGAAYEGLTGGSPSTACTAPGAWGARCRRRAALARGARPPGRRVGDLGHLGARLVTAYGAGGRADGHGRRARPAGGHPAPRTADDRTAPTAVAAPATAETEAAGTGRVAGPSSCWRRSPWRAPSSRVGRSDWSAVRLERLGAGPGAAALGFAAFMAGHAGGPADGDRLTDRHGGAPCSAAGWRSSPPGWRRGPDRPPAVFGRGLVLAGFGASGSFRWCSLPRPRRPGVAPGAGRPPCRWPPGWGSSSSRSRWVRWPRTWACAGRTSSWRPWPPRSRRRRRSCWAGGRPGGHRGCHRRPADGLTRAGRSPGHADPQRCRSGTAPARWRTIARSWVPPPPSSPGPTPPRSTAPSPRRDLVTPVAIALTLVPFVVLAVHMLRTDVFLSADLATAEMLTRDVGSHSPSLGPFSRDGWFHPGPALFYVLAPSYRLFGSDGSALAVGAVVVNALSVAAVGLLARRRGGTGLMLAALLGVAVLMHALGPTFLATPWNVYVTVLPYAALLFTIWAVVAGERWALPVATLLTSFLMQTHVGYVALALPLLAAGAAWAVGAAVVDRRRRAHDPDTPPGPRSSHPTTSPASRPARPTPSCRRRARRPRARPRAPRMPPSGAGSSGGLLGPLVVSAAIGVLMWLPPVVQQVTHAQGNVDRIVEWFREGDDAARTLLEGWRVVADQYTWPPEWIAGQAPLAFGNEPAAVYDRVVPILLLAVLAAAGYLWWRRGDRRAPWSRRGSWPLRWRSSPRRARSGPSTPTACTGCGPSGWSGASSWAGRRGRWPPGARVPAPARRGSRWRSPRWPR